MMKKDKRILSLLLSLTMAVGSVWVSPGITASAALYDTTQTAPVSNTGELANRLAATAADSDYGDGKTLAEPSSGGSFVYAAKVFRYIFGMDNSISFSLADSSSCSVTCSSKTAIYFAAGYDLSSDSASYAMTQSLSAMPGDFVQTVRSGQGSHTMIVYGVSASDGTITVLDCDYDGNNVIHKRTMDASAFVSAFPKARFYRYLDYPPEGSSGGSGGESGGGSEEPSPSSSYRPADAVAYAYSNFSSFIGTDADFVSACLRGGGLSAAACSDAGTLYSFMLGLTDDGSFSVFELGHDNTSAGYVRGDSRLAPGDVIIIKSAGVFEHTGIVTSLDTYGLIGYPFCAQTGVAGSSGTADSYMCAGYGYYSQPVTVYCFHYDSGHKTRITGAAAEYETSVSYTGSEVYPSVELTYGGNKLVAGRDYYISCVNNVKIGTATAIVVGMGDFTGSFSFSFSIVEKDLGEGSISVQDQTYTGSALCPDVTVYDDQGTQLIPGIDFDIYYSDNTDIGTATVTVTGKGNYKGSLTATFRITPKSTLDLTVIDIPDETYNGREHCPVLWVYDEGKRLKEGTDYSVSYRNNVNAGTASAIVKGEGRYSGTAEVPFVILPLDMTLADISEIVSDGIIVPAQTIAGTDGKVTGWLSDRVYTGSEIVPRLKVSIGTEILLNENTDYKYSISANTGVGTASVTLTALGSNFSGSAVLYFNIKPRSIENASVKAYDAFYTGDPIIPETLVKLGSVTLTKDTDYTVSCVNNVNVGTASVTVSGTGNYTGSVQTVFSINKSNIGTAGFTVSSIPDQYYTGGEICPEVTVNNGSTVLEKDTDYTVVYKNNTAVGKKTASVTVTGTGNYDGERTVTFTILPRSVADLTFSAIPDQIYTGYEIKPELTVTDGKKTLTQGRDYSLVYSDNISAGTAAVTVCGIEGSSYSGTKQINFRICYNVSAPSASAKPGEKSVLLSWNSVLGAEKYMVSSYANGKYTTIASDVTATSYKVTGLTPGRQYSFIVQAFVNGTWSDRDIGYLVSAEPYSIVPTAAAKAGDTIVTLTWNEVPGASRYAVYRYENEEFTLLTNKLTLCEYTAMDLENGRSYSFLVSALVDKIWSEVDESYVVSAVPFSRDPVVTAAAGELRAVLKWGAVRTASRYAVIDYTDGEPVTVSDKITSLSYTISGLEAGKTYSYLVLSYVDGEWSEADKSHIVTVTPYTTVPAATAKAGNREIILSWNAVEGAVKYAVSSYSGGNMTLISNKIVGQEYTVTGLSEDVEYTFIVQSYVNGKWSSGDLKYSVSATPYAVIPEASAKAGDRSVTVTWAPINGAAKYAVSFYENGSYTLISNKITGTSYTVNGLEAGKKYYFIVQAYAGKKWSERDTRYIVYATPYSNVPELSATAGNGQIMLSWKEISGAQKYAVYSCADGVQTLVSSSITGTGYIVTGLVNGEEYTYAAESFVGGVWSGTDLSKAVSAVPFDNTPDIDAVPGDEEITLSWEPVDGAVKYAVSEYKNGDYTVLSSRVYTTEYTVKGLLNGFTYSFLVQSYDGNSWSVRDPEKIVSATPFTNAPVVRVTEGDRQIKLTWDAVEGAEKYAVSRYINNSYDLIADDITELEYTDTKLVGDTEYAYLVQSFKDGEWNEKKEKNVVRGTPYTTVPLVTATPGDSKVTLSWKPVEGASKYAVSFYNNDGTYTLISNKITATKFTKTGLTNGTSYGFIVQAYFGKTWSERERELVVSAMPYSDSPRPEAIAGNGDVKLCWEEMPGAAKYAVFMTEDGEEVLLSNKITDTYYLVSGLENGKTYSFIVLAYYSGTKKWSEKNSEYAVEAVPSATIPVLRITEGNTQVTLEWDAIPNAVKYAVTLIDGDTTTLLSNKIRDTGYTVTGLTNEKSYKILVQSYYTAENGKMKWSSSDVLNAVTVIPRNGA